MTTTATASLPTATGTPTPSAEDFEALAERVDAAVNEIRQLDADARRKAMALRSAIEEFHKVGLTKIVKTLKDDERGKELLFALVDDPAVYALFSMHGIVRADLSTRVLRVLDMVRPYMQSHGGDVEFDRVEGDTVFVKLHGACNGCSMAAVTLREGVEEALTTQIPEIRKVDVTPTDPGPALISLESLMADIDEKGWIQGPAVADVTPGTIYRLDADDLSIVIVNIANQLNAYRNACAHQGLPIDGGLIDESAGTLTCPWHGFCFDATSGDCFTAPAAQLESFPLRVTDGRIWVRPG